MSLMIDNKVFVNTFETFIAAKSKGRVYFKINEDRSLSVTTLKSESSLIQDVISLINEVAQRAILSNDFSTQDSEKVAEVVACMKRSFESKQARFWIWLRNFFIGDKIHSVLELFDQFRVIGFTHSDIYKSSPQASFDGQGVSLVSNDDDYINSPYRSFSTTSLDFSTGSSSLLSQNEVKDEQNNALENNSCSIESLSNYDARILQDIDKIQNRNFIGPFHVDKTQGLVLGKSRTYRAFSTSRSPSVDEILTLSPYQNLKALSFIDSHFSDDHFIALSQLTNLKELAFFNCDGFNSQSIELLGKLKQLTHITFYGCTSFDNESGNSLATLSTLESLVLKDCSPIKECSFHCIDKLMNLSELKISFEVLSGECIYALRHLETLKNFTLFVTETIDEAGMATINYLQNITELDFAKSSTSDQSLIDKQFNTLCGLDKLKILKLRFNKDLTDACIDTIRSFSSLESLDIHATSISEEGILRLKSLMQLKDLKIGKGFGVVEPKITNKIMQGLAALEALNTLQIINTDITPDDACLFKEAHPHVHVTDYFVV